MAVYISEDSCSVSSLPSALSPSRHEPPGSRLFGEVSVLSAEAAERSLQRSSDAGRVDTSPYRPRLSRAEPAGQLKLRGSSSPVVVASTPQLFQLRLLALLAGPRPHCDCAGRTPTTTNFTNVRRRRPRSSTQHPIPTQDRRRSATIETDPRRSTHPLDDGRPQRPERRVQQPGRQRRAASAETHISTADPWPHHCADESGYDGAASWPGWSGQRTSGSSPCRRGSGRRRRRRRRAVSRSREIFTAAAQRGAREGRGRQVPDLLSLHWIARERTFEDQCVLHEEGVQWLHFGGTSARIEVLPILQDASPG